MKKFAIVLAVLICVGVAVLVFLPKEYRFEIPAEDLQKKANEKFPQTIGKAIKLELPMFKESSENTERPKLPGFPPKPGGDGPPIPKLPKPKGLEYILAEILLQNPKITLSEGAMHIGFTIDIRVMLGYVFEFESSEELAQNAEYEKVAENVATKFTDKYTLSSQAKMKHTGKGTWMIQDRENLYLLTKENSTVQVFQTQKEGTKIRSISSHAQAQISGRLQYEREAKTVFFENVQVEALELDKLPDIDFAPMKMPMKMIREALQQQVNKVLQEQKIPVANLKDTAEKNQPKIMKLLGMLFLKDITILDDKLVITLSLKKDS